ncbi:MAG: phosphohydrolase [Sphaerochaetaceae bacterium]|jgi:metal-dependent HD superfamily phosphatase/phosphodiesterase|nr:phosphohydrolase [Sphaerochaetaceae bacterium]MDD3162621.1 phosphohydrolase [Sphaerochaetaceae bacterium]MDD4007249.1 phosphohydrolase [Sphaerochaetaceae bacterium]MDD4396107.1 phosphohydrolase [Sphaerochaetaceae bacterium]
MKSPKEIALEKRLAGMFEEGSSPWQLSVLLAEDQEIQEIQDYANNVAIKRLGFNDHGPVHMRQVSINAMRMLDILHKKGIKTSLEEEEAGSYDDSTCGVLLSCFLHDFGMSIGRQDHEIMSAMLAEPVIRRVLAEIKGLTQKERTIIRCLAMEGIVGHMATRKIHSLEAGLVLIADGCDMEKGRARIPLAISSEESHYGDIHKYSANSIEKVTIEEGQKRPIRITVHMSSEVGCFQVEEVLMPKINMSPAKGYLELVAIVAGGPERHYL